MLSAIYFMLPKVQGVEPVHQERGFWSYRLMVVGMLFMILAFTLAGTGQVYLNRVVGLDFLLVRDQYVRFWIFWVWFFGLVLFLPGVLIYLLDLVNIRPATKPNWLKSTKISTP